MTTEDTHQPARSVTRQALKAFIYLYRALSVNSRPACRFVPSCSEYAIEALDRFRNGDGDAPHACFNTVESPIRAMMNEHESAGALLDSMRAATKNFMAPEGACPTTVGLMDGLDAFERDLHRHVHLENNLLFPLAIDLEKKLAAERS